MPWGTTRSSAQRLSASTEGSPDVGSAKVRSLGVLNAFRHLRKVHAAQKGCVAPAACAQRLSASTEGSRLGALIVIMWQIRAQRLSASTEGSPVRSGPSASFVRVLNAFRHLRKVHSRTAAPATITASAQRLSASTEGSPP